MDLVDEVGKRLLNHRPALIAELLHCRSLGCFPERQRFQESGFAGPREGQDSAAVMPFWADRNISLLLEWPQISGQRRAFHFHLIGQRLDR